MLQKSFLIIFLSFLTATILHAQFPAIPIDSSYNVASTYQKIHKNFPEAIPATDSLPANVIAARNMIYTTLSETPFGKRDLHLDVFRPKENGLHPALIMVHGGGWRSGTRSMQVPMAEMLAAQGIVTIPVEYQLSLEAKYPAAVHNIKSAIRWVRLHAAQYEIDTNRISISGCSAGGHLASLVGMTNGVANFEGNMGNVGASSFVKSVIDIDGVIDFMLPTSLNQEQKPNAPDVEWLGGSFAERPLIWKDASPIFWAKKESAVPVLFLNSGYSRFHAGQDELIGMMNEWGVYTQVHKFNVMMHPFWLFHPWVDETVDLMAAFLLKK